MISTNVGPIAVWIVTNEPRGDQSVHLAPKIPVDSQRAKGGAATRRPEGLYSRYSLEWTSILTSREYADLRNSTQAAQNEPILTPVWPFMTRVGVDTPAVTGGLTIAFKMGWSSWAINPTSTAGYDFVAPLMWGKFTQIPRTAGHSVDKVQVDFSVDENSPAPYVFGPVDGLLPADTTFESVTGFAAAVFPFFPEYTKPPSPPIATADVEWNNEGPGRQQSSVFYPQIPELTYQATFKFTTPAAAAKLLAWWQRRAGITDPHWVIAPQKVGNLSADLAIGATNLNFTKAIAALASNAYIGLSDPVGNFELAQVSSSTSTAIVTELGLAKAWPAAFTTVAPAFLAVHSDEAPALEFVQTATGWMATCTLSWREVAPEYTPPAGETRGITLGALPPRAWFFRIDMDFAGAIQSWYLTNWEAGAAANDQNWTYNACSFDKWVQSIDLEDDSLTFKLRWYDGCPWENWKPGQLSARGFLTLYSADMDRATGVASNFTQEWKGELTTPTPTGPNLSVKVMGANALFARLGPRQLMSPICGTNLFKPRCGLALADWQWSAVVVSIAGLNVTLGTFARTNATANPSGFGAVNWWALGWVQWSIGGIPYRGLSLSDTGIDGGSGQCTITLTRPVAVAVGASVLVAPGCDRVGTTCRGKFFNYANFRGFENMPAISPSFIIPQTNTSPAKK